MRTLSTFVVIAAVALAAGCRRNTGPSLEYIEAKGLYDRLIVNQGDDAYTSEQMAEVEALLKKVEPDSPDAPAAKELLATIASERQRVEEEARAAAVPETAPDLSAQFESAEEEAPPAEAQAEAAVDAGVEFPTVGMSEAEFTRKFSDCFVRGEELLVQGLGPRQRYDLRDSTDCQTRFKGLAGLSVIIDAEKVAGFARVNPAGPQGNAQPGQPRPQQPSTASPAAPQGPYAPPPLPPADPNVTRPESTPADRGTTKEDYDSIKY